MINHIVPTPKKQELYEGTVSLNFAVHCEEPEWIGYVSTLSKAFEKLFGHHLSDKEDGIIIQKDGSVSPGG